jgi:hypothetical protein
MLRVCRYMGIDRYLGNGGSRNNENYEYEIDDIN